MERVGTITTPIERVMKHVGSDAEVIDILMDTHEGIAVQYLNVLKGYNNENGLAIIPSKNKTHVAFLMYKPEPIWKAGDKTYLVWVPPSIHMLINHFKRFTAECKNDNDYQQVQKVLKYLNQNESTSLKYNYVSK